MNRQISITFKAKLTGDLPVNIESLSKSFSDLGIYETNIEKQLKIEFKELIDNDLKWVLLLLKDKKLHERFLTEYIDKLISWIKDWRDAENISAGSNYLLLDQLRNTLRETRIRILGIMLWRNPKGIQEAALNDVNTIQNIGNKILEFVQGLYNSCKDRRLETLILLGKRDYFKSNCWPPGQNSLSSKDFFDLFNGDFNLFLEKGINEIFINEIKKNLNLSEKVTFMDLERIYNYFFGCYLNFVKFLNRNYQYELIEKGLEKQLINYINLQNSINTTLKSRKLVITNCPFPQYRLKTFELKISGLEGSPRYCNDKLVIFGKDAYEEFTTDISLPNTKGIDSIFAFIFINNQGYNLVDISKSACIRMKLGPGAELELKNDMIIVFAKTHAYVVEIAGSVSVLNQNMSKLSLKPSLDCPASVKDGGLEVSPNGNRLIIGRIKENCNLVLNHPDISHRHAEIYFNSSNSKWLLKDLSSTNGTFYKLKTQKELENMEPSQAFKLEGKVVFCVQSFTFLIKEEDDID